MTERIYPADMAYPPVRFPFAFARPYVVPALLFGIRPATAWAEVGDELRVRFGPWRLRTPLDNVASASETGGVSYLKTAGPAHLSWTDRGVTFATNGGRAVCLTFHDPVPAIDPTGRIRHPGATLTVADPGALLHSLRR